MSQPTVRPPGSVPGECICEKCWEPHGDFWSIMHLCSICGNKRCPKATDCDLECTNSNAPGQKGSSYE